MVSLSAIAATDASVSRCSLSQERVNFMACSGTRFRELATRAAVVWGFPPPLRGRDREGGAPRILSLAVSRMTVTTPSKDLEHIIIRESLHDIAA